MKFSIIAVALSAAILGQAIPISDPSTYIGTETPASDILTSQDAADSSPMYTESADLANHDDLAGSVCPPGLRVAGFARLADYTVYGSDFDGAALASRYADGFFDNFGGPIIARALAKSDALPGKSEVFVQAQNANYFWHKSGTVAQVIGGLSPNRDYATYVAGGCSQFTGDVLAKCCH